MYFVVLFLLILPGQMEEYQTFNEAFLASNVFLFVTLFLIGVLIGAAYCSVKLWK